MLTKIFHEHWIKLHIRALKRKLHCNVNFFSWLYVLPRSQRIWFLKLLNLPRREEVWRIIVNLTGNWSLEDRSLIHLAGYLHLLKTSSDKIIYWSGRYSFHLGFIMSKTTKGLWFSILIKCSVGNNLFFYKTQKERVSTKWINYLIIKQISK